MSNEQASGMTAEQRVESAVYDAECISSSAGKYYIYSMCHAPSGNGVLSDSARGFKTKFEAWESALAHPTVKAFEAEHRPSNGPNEQLGHVNVPSVFGVAPDSGKGFEEWFANMTDGEPLTEDASMQTKIVAHAAWNAALASPPAPEGESKVTWRVDADEKRWDFETEEYARAAYTLASIMVGRPDGYEEVSWTRVLKTVVETRKKEA